MQSSLKKCLLTMLVISGFAIMGSASAQTLSGADLISALRKGGYVLLMRHASSPRTPPDSAAANPDNPTLERQLDAAGRTAARTMGEEFRRLKIPVGEVLSSPTYRALETVRFAGFAAPRTFDELGDGGHSMQPDTDKSHHTWLQDRIAKRPPAGSNTVIVTHLPNVTAALGKEWSNLADSETLVIRPDGNGGGSVIARVKKEDWSGFDAR